MSQVLKFPIHTPIEFISGGHFISEKPWIHTKRNIDSFEVIIGTNKTLYMEQSGLKYEVNPGDVLVILPHEEHKGYALGEGNLSFYWFHFLCPKQFEIIDKATMKKEISIKSLLEKEHESETFIYLPIFYSPNSIERINILFSQLLHIYQSNYYTNHSGHYMASLILIELTEQAINQHSTGDKNLNSLLEWTRIHALENITVTSIAQKFCYNREYLSRYFKKKTGMTLIEYIHHIKISKAKDYLTSTNDSIKEIAYGVGFQDEKYFMKLFKKYERMTPTEYRTSYFRTKMNNH